MLQKITSWFRLTINQNGFWKNYFNLSVLKGRIYKFFQNHPRLGGGIIISSVLLFLLVFLFIWNLTPVKFGAKETEVFKVTYGSSLREITKSLKENGFIRNQFAYELYVRLYPKQRMAKAGYYKLGAGMSVPRIVWELRRGIPPMVKVTIPEGLTIQETANLLAQKGLVNRDKFIALAKDTNFIGGILGEYQFSEWPEGCLFPDTYNIELDNEPEKEILTKMLLRFKEVIEENFRDLTSAKQREVIIIASMVEKEARKAAERPIIAGIFYNRLKLGYPLQSCATVQYSLGKRKERLYYKDLQVNSPYNTYLHQGLPPGPIANPGLASIKAAVNPTKVNYLYFVARPDGTHVFSKTYRQHLNAQRKIGQLILTNGS